MPRVKFSHRGAYASPVSKPTPRSKVSHFKTPYESPPIDTKYQWRPVQELRKHASEEDQPLLENWWEERGSSPNLSDITFIGVRCNLAITAVEDWVRQRLKREAAAARASRRSRRASTVESEYVGNQEASCATSGTSRGSSRVLRSTSITPEDAVEEKMVRSARVPVMPVIKETRKRRTPEEMKAFGRWYASIWSVRGEIPKDVEYQAYAEGEDRDWHKVKAECKKYHDKFVRLHVAGTSTPIPEIAAPTAPKSTEVDVSSRIVSSSNGAGKVTKRRRATSSRASPYPGNQSVRGSSKRQKNAPMVAESTPEA